MTPPESAGGSRPLPVPAEAGRGVRAQMLARVLRNPGLMPLLMKQRNGQPWSDAERHGLRKALRHLSGAAPWLAALALPGGLVLLPLLAWWLDRRRQRRPAEPPAGERR